MRSIRTTELRDDAVRRNRKSVIIRVLKSLSEQDRDVLKRLFLEGRTKEEVGRLLKITPAQVQSITARAKARFAELQNKRVPEGETVMAHALETFGSPEKTDHWLNRPNEIFQGHTPLEVLKTDPQAVEIELTRIDHGVYI